jgi:putative transcriptional regulator
MRNHVQFFRRAKHLRQDELAARVGVTRECINAIEKGRFLPSVTLAYNIAFALNRYIHDVFPPVAPLSASLAHPSAPNQRFLISRPQ